MPGDIRLDLTPAIIFSGKSEPLHFLYLAPLLTPYSLYRQNN
ncbi:MAG: hypothetical protein ACI832_002920 [Rheinheimera aquimaris]|jgi:hypothetical protein|tara:strand:- start:933 stop:1058 length:126 start_codon:yes stop_codon:yes gene_type:complete